MIQSLKENWVVLPKIDMRNLANFHQSIWKSPNWNIDGILFSSWKCTSLNLHVSYVSWQWRMMQKLKRNWLVSSKLTWGIWQILTRALESLKNVNFNRLLLTKVHNVWAKKSIEELFDGTKDWCKIWRNSDLCFLEIFVYRLKNSDFILKSKMAEFN